MNYFFLLVNLFFALESQGQSNQTSLQVSISGASSDAGSIRILVFSKPSGFPDQVKQAVRSISLLPKNGKANFKLTDLPAGTYAIGVIHDQDNNGKLSSNAVGYPTEKFGFSNNPKVYFGPPAFEKAAFVLGKTPVLIEISLR
ncbi:MAG: DUF2141 domain-containing protein [Algoriphagus sp.]|nr:DUF2141 domain-containing protein [Algoriphagus sp.]